MARTTASKVQSILTGQNYDGSTDLFPFIEAATDVVDQVKTCASDRNVTLSSTTLELIERWLTAHFYVASDPLYSEKKTADASGKFQGRDVTRFDNIGLDSTDYGRRAKMLDRSGCLASIADGKRATAFWLGKPPSDQIDYPDRD